MKIQKGIVKYKDRNDIVCTYGITDDSTNYYFLDLGHDYKLPNGNIIASTELVEAIDPMYQASHVGVIDGEGKVILPFTHKSIRLIDDKYLLVELAQPVSESVLEANQMRKDPALATKLVSTPALIKERLNSKMEGQGRYLFNDQFSEATVCDLNGDNLLNGEYYSFIAETAGKLYFSKNTVDGEIKEFSTLPAEVQNDVVESASQGIDVSEVKVPTEVVENAMTDSTPSENSSESKSDENKFGKELIEESQAVGAVTDITKPKTEEVVEEESVDKEENVVQDIPNPNTVVEKLVSPSEKAVTESVNEEDSQVKVDDSQEIKEDSQTEVDDSQEIKENASLPSSDVVSEKEEEAEETLKIAVDEDKDTEMEETPDNVIDEADEEEVKLDEKMEDSTLDDLFHTVNQYYEEEEDPLKDYKVETDVIEPMSEYDTQFEDSSDSIVSDVAKYMNALLEQNRGLLEQNDKLLKQNDQLKENLEKVLASRKLLLDKSAVQDKQIESLKVKVSKLEKINREQGKVIEAQAKDRTDLEKILSNVRDVLGEDTYSNDSVYIK